MIQDYLQYL